MNTEHHIDEYIRKEKGLEANPFLATRVMAQIDLLQRSNQSESQKVGTGSKATSIKHSSLRLQTLAIAASFALVIAIGIGAGSLHNSSRDTTALNINDNQIENRTFLNTLTYE